MTDRQSTRAQSFVDARIDVHWTRSGRDPSLLTVAHTPNGIVTSVISAETAAPPLVRYDEGSGRVITEHVTRDYGVILSVLGGPAVVEIAIHADSAQREDYLRAIDAVDAEAARHVMVASRTAVLTILQHLGMPAEDPEESS